MLCSMALELGQGLSIHAFLCGPLSWGWELVIHALFLSP